jgi:hypothetical protein
MFDFKWHWYINLYNSFNTVADLGYFLLEKENSVYRIRLCHTMIVFLKHLWSTDHMMILLILGVKSTTAKQIVEGEAQDSD